MFQQDRERRESADRREGRESSERRTKKKKKVLKQMLKKYFNRKKFKEQKMRNKLFRLCITVGVFSTFNFTLIQFII